MSNNKGYYYSYLKYDEFEFQIFFLIDKMQWFSGYCDADGTIANNGDNQQLQMASINYEFLLNIKMIQMVFRVFISSF